MGLELPSTLAEPLSWTGVSWPEGDEDGITEAARVWEKFEKRLTDIREQADDGADLVVGRNEGPAADAFESWWYAGGFFGIAEGPSKQLEDDTKAAVSVAGTLAHFAALTVALKQYFIIRLTFLAKEVEWAEKLPLVSNWLRDLAISRAQTDLGNQINQVVDTTNGDIQEAFDKAKTLMKVLGWRATKQQGEDRQRTMEEIAAALEGTNPNFGSDSDFGVNCVHCVQAYELRRRGFDVEATALPDRFNGGGRPLSDIEDTWGRDFTDGDQQDIEQAFGDAGPGARGVVYIDWNGSGAHVFNVENVDGRVVFVDGQNNTIDASDYFARGGNTKYVRLDDLPTPDVDDSDEYVD